MRKAHLFSPVSVGSSHSDQHDFVSVAPVFPSTSTVAQSTRIPAALVVESETAQ